MSVDDKQTTIRRCHATILFADVCSSTQLAEICDPESLAEVLYQIRETAERVVAQHHGVINQFYGDGVLAAFGFPIPHEHDVLNATEAALALNEAVANLPLKKFLPKKFKLRLHTGVHAGLMVVQDGDRLQGQYKLYGDALNTAARLADAADEHEVFTSESTLRGVLPYFEVQKLPPLMLKGKGAALPAYKVLRRTAVRTRFEASVRKGLAPFVGRSFELRELDQRLQRALSSQLQAVKVIGDAGLGKTRLIEEFLSLQDSSVRIYRGYCEQSGRAVPLQPFIQIMRRCFNLESEATPGQALAAIEERLAILGDTISGYYHVFTRLLSLTPEDKSSPIAPDTITQAIVALLGEISKWQPLILFIDDWHWVDDLSRQVLNELVLNLGGRPMLILLSCRHEDLADRSLGHTSFRLDPFTAQEARKAVASLFTDGVDLRIAESIFERSGGNALFIEELCQSLKAESYDEAIKRDSWFEVPSTLHGLIESRMDRLPAEQLELVRAAAVIGHVVPAWLLEKVLGYKLPQDLILELSHQDMLYLTDAKDELRFKHGLTRDVVYQSVTLQERQRIHQQVAGILQQATDSSGGDEYYEALAYHYNGADQETLALKYAELSGDKALASLALDRARLQYQMALEVMDELDDSSDNYQRRNDIVLRLGWACVFDPHPEQIATLQRELQLAQQHNDLVSEARTEYWLGYINYSLGRSTPAICHCEKALDGARRLEEKGLEVHVLATLAQSWATKSDYSKALALFDEAQQLREQHKPGKDGSLSAAYSLACRAFVIADHGDFQQAQQQFDTICQTVAGVDTEMEGSVWALRAAAYIWQGCWLEAVDAAVRSQELARKITSTYVLGISTVLGAYAQWRLDGEQKHINDILEASDWLEAKGKGLFSSLSFGFLAEAFAKQGEYNRVRYFTARALWRARQGDRLGEAMAYRAMASIASKAARLRPYHYYLDRALASAQVRRSRYERALTTHCHARQLLLTNADRARTLFESAAAEFEAMGMSWYVENCQGSLQYS